MKHADVAALVDKAIQAWSGIDTAKISFEKQPEIPTDVTGANLGDFLNNLSLFLILFLNFVLAS